MDLDGWMDGRIEIVLDGQIDRKPWMDKWEIDVDGRTDR